MENLSGSIVLALASAVAWGTGDFCAGWSTRRVPVMIVTWFSQMVGLIFLIALAVVGREQGLMPVEALWGVLASITGTIGLMALYRAMAVGQMSIAAPITAVLAAALPVIFGAATEGLPGSLTLTGFGLALAGTWFISSMQNARVRRAGIGLALLGGFGFGIFFICLGQFGDGLVFLPLVIVRLVSLSVIGLTLVTRQEFRVPPRNILPVILFAGLADAGGNIFFVLAKQTGRLDITSVLSSLYPVATVFLALILLRERLTRPQIIGVMLIFLAIPLIALG